MEGRKGRLKGKREELRGWNLKEGWEIGDLANRINREEKKEDEEEELERRTRRRGERGKKWWRRMRNWVHGGKMRKR